MGILFTDAPMDLPSDFGLWRSSFAALVVRRSIPLWRIANLPAVICDRPADLVAIAMKSVDRLDAIYPDLRAKHNGARGWIDDAWVGRARSIVHVAVDEVAEAYGPGPAGELLLWLGRNEANWAAHSRWWRWSLLFGRLASGRQALPDSLQHCAALVQSVAQLMEHPIFQTALDQAEAAAKAIPLDSLEERVLKYDIGTQHADSEDSSQDVVTQLYMAAVRERAYLGHCLLAMVLAARDLKALEQLAPTRLG